MLLVYRSALNRHLYCLIGGFIQRAPVDARKQLLVDCYGGRRRRYWCAARDSLIRAMEDHLKKLGRTGDAPLLVERVGSWEVRISVL